MAAPQPDHPPAAASSSRSPGRGAPTAKAASPAVPLGARGPRASPSPQGAGAGDPNLGGPPRRPTQPTLLSSKRSGFGVTSRPGAESDRLLPRQGCAAVSSRARPPGLRLLPSGPTTRPPRPLRGLRVANTSVSTPNPSPTPTPPADSHVRLPFLGGSLRVLHS